MTTACARVAPWAMASWSRRYEYKIIDTGSRSRPLNQARLRAGWLPHRRCDDEEAAVHRAAQAIILMREFEPTD